MHLCSPLMVARVHAACACGSDAAAVDPGTTDTAKTTAPAALQRRIRSSIAPSYSDSTNTLPESASMLHFCGQKRGGGDALGSDRGLYLAGGSRRLRIVRK